MIPAVFIPGRAPLLRSYTAAIYAAGGVPICSTDDTAAGLCRCLLLPGGGDIGKSLDESERKLIQSFVERGQPILGICRGMQALNVFFGGTLYNRIPGHQQVSGDLLHATNACGWVAGILGGTPTVNSNHHQAIHTVGSGLQVVQAAGDGIAEAIQHAVLPIYGVQWHPERQSFGQRRPDAADAAGIFRFFLTQAR